MALSVISRMQLSSKPIKILYFIYFLESRTGDVHIRGSAVAQFIERPIIGEEVVGSIPVVATRSLLVGSGKYNVTG